MPKDFIGAFDVATGATHTWDYLEKKPDRLGALTGKAYTSYKDVLADKYRSRPTALDCQEAVESIEKFARSLNGIHPK